MNNTSANTDFLSNSPAASQPQGSVGSKASSVLDGVNNSLKNFGDAAAGKVGKLSTTQKVVGGLALALGISYLSKLTNKRSA
ncbi:hypothetical protein F0P96_14785 [Hymenobacter busanensis]|uniref:Uncharacterized protein n=1 Tax=Hymenobacter busanensis TaxID=2607656 RepID=A0A7L4ZZH2_9BACT|nr:hypothetical protein [Hymenobacter busanensis]KAA9331504.1 hypothetical protein F0P96_14785 [Hymenobacter busanensis]QHJ08658.1 hypothetical protein GUY19_15720 [Hymenobacter busanensis]